MGAHILDVNATLQCPHGGQGTVISTNTRVKVGGALAVLATDMVTIAGCPFVAGTVAMPCLTVQWLVPANRDRVSSTPVLLETSVGLCLNATQAPQGTLIVNGVQAQVSGE